MAFFMFATYLQQRYFTFVAEKNKEKIENDNEKNLVSKKIKLTLRGFLHGQLFQNRVMGSPVSGG